MYLRIKGTGFTENVFAEINALTDRAMLKIRHVNYRKDAKAISFPIERYAIIGKSKFFGAIVPYKIDRHTKIKSVVTIKNVIDCEIQNNIDDTSISEVMILLGMKVQENQVYVCSAEEAQGVTCYSIDLRVSEIDIEIKDEDEGSPR